MSYTRQHPARRAVVRCRAALVPVFLGLALSACATGRSVVDVEPLAAAPPEGTAFVKITEVRDLRKFETAPSEPSIPSLGDAAQINDPQITGRVVARKRSDFGTPLGEVVLPDGITVAALVRSAAQRALGDAGYAVVDETSPDYAKALPLALDIDQFWAWSERGGPAIPLEFEALVTMKGDALVGHDAPPAKGRASDSSAMVLAGSWGHLVETGLADLADKMKEQIKPASALTADAAPAEPRAADAGPDAAAQTPAAPMPLAPAAPDATAPPPPAPVPRAGGLAGQLDGRWISYQDAFFTGAPAPARQQMLLSRCAKSYTLFAVKASRLIEDFHQGSEAWRNEYAIASQPAESLAVRSVDAPGQGMSATVFLAQEERLAEISFPPAVLEFDIRAPQQGNARYPARKYARCPVLP